MKRWLVIQPILKSASTVSSFNSIYWDNWYELFENIFVFQFCGEMLNGKKKDCPANAFCVLTYCSARWLRWAVSAGWFVCEGSEHSRCSRSWCLLGEHWRSTSLHSEPGTLVYPAGASGNLNNGDGEGIGHETACTHVQSYLFCCMCVSLCHVCR